MPTLTDIEDCASCDDRYQFLGSTCIADGIFNAERAVTIGGITTMEHPFITEWAVSNNQTVTIPTNSDYTSYNYQINYDALGANTYSVLQTTLDPTCTYTTGGNYYIAIAGDFLNSMPTNFNGNIHD